MNRLSLPSEHFPFCLLLSRLEASLTLFFHDLRSIWSSSQIHFSLNFSAFASLSRKRQQGREEKKRRREREAQPYDVELQQRNASKHPSATCWQADTQRQVQDRCKTLRPFCRNAKRKRKERERERIFFSTPAEHVVVFTDPPYPFFAFLGRSWRLCISF